MKQLDHNLYRLPVHIPSAYRSKDIMVWTDFLGEKFISFEQVRLFVKKLKLKNCAKWWEYCKSGKKPDNIPSCPQKFYKNKGWKNWGDFLGTGHTSTYQEDYLTFRRAKIFVIKLKLKSKREWDEYCKSGKKPDNIPFAPYKVYKNKGWISWYDFLGTQRK